MIPFKSCDQIINEIPTLKKFKLNKTGRDFVIGDIHGKFTLFEALLNAINFDPKTDRIFSTGDLIDRGGFNEECLRLLKEPWFNACIGNHEFFAIACAHKAIDMDLWISNGGRWAIPHYTEMNNKRFDKNYRLSQQADEFWHELFPEILEMPKMMSVRLRNWKKFHVIHAELNPYQFNLTDKNLLREDFIESAWGYSSAYGGIEPSECDGMWRRNIFYNGHTPNLADGCVEHEKLSTIFSGHTIQSWAPRKIGSFVCMDTGSFLGNRKNNGISICEVETLRCWKSNDFGVTEVEMNFIPGV